MSVPSAQKASFPPKKALIGLGFVLYETYLSNFSIFFMSSSDNEKSSKLLFSAMRCAFTLLGKITMPHCSKKRNRTCAGLFSWAVAISMMTGSFNGMGVFHVSALRTPPPRGV
eukprot:709665_1